LAIMFEMLMALVLAFAPAGASEMTIKEGSVDATFVRAADGWWTVQSKDAPNGLQIRVQGDVLTKRQIGKPAETFSRAKLIPLPKNFNPKSASELKLGGAVLTITWNRKGHVFLTPKDGKGPSLRMMFKRPSKSSPAKPAKPAPKKK